MRKALLFLLTLLNFPHGSFGYEHLSSTYTSIVFTDQSNMREAPSLSAKVICKIPQLAFIEICHYQDASDTINGEPGYWTSIKYENKIGYLWNRNLAIGHFKSHLDTDVEFLIQHSQKKGLEIKVFNDAKLLIHEKFKRPKINHLSGSTTFGKTFNSKGNEVIAVVYNDTLYELFEWNGSELRTSTLKLNDESFITGRYTHYPYGYINANNVRLRAEPDSGAEVLTSLSPRSKLLLIEPDSITRQEWDRSGFWQKVKWKKGIAYVWSEYLDRPLHYIKSNKRENEAFLHTSGGLYVLREDTIAFHLPIAHVDEYRDRNFVNFGSRGLNEKYQFLSICHSAFSCGEDSGDELYTWDGDKLKFLYYDGGVGDGGISDYFSLIFPNEPDGIKNRLIKYDAYSEPDQLVLDQNCNSYGSSFVSEIYSIMEFNGDTLLEVASKHLEVKKLVASKYPHEQLMHYHFFDGNKDGLEDVVFFLHHSNYEHPEQNRSRIGIAYGRADGSFGQPLVNESMVKTGFFSVQYTSISDTLEIVIKYNTGMYNREDANASYSRYKFVYDKELKAMIWSSLTTAETYRSAYPIHMSDPITEYFKTNRIRFEKAW